MGSNKVHSILVFLRVIDEEFFHEKKGLQLAKQTAIGEGWTDITITLSQDIENLEHCSEMLFSQKACEATVKNGTFVMSKWKPGD